MVKENGEVAPNVCKAVHIVSLDDNQMFKGNIPLLFMGLQNTTKVPETLFAGEHGDIGGRRTLEKGLSDCACKNMQEWMEKYGIEFKTDNDIIDTAKINDCLTIDGEDDFNRIDLFDTLSINPNATQRNHMLSIQMDTNKNLHCPVIVTHFDKHIPEATVSIHISALEHINAHKNNRKEYVINPNLDKVLNDVVIVGFHGAELKNKTNEFVQLVENYY